MIKILLKTLMQHHWLALMGIAFILSSIGNGLTFVTVFGELLHLNAPASSLAVAYILASAPGILGSKLGEFFCQKYSPFYLLIFGEIIALVGLILPTFGIAYKSIPALYFAECASAFTIGMSFPALSLIFKKGLSENELPAATSLETLAFASYVLFGVGTGVFLYGLLSPFELLALDSFSFIISILFIVFSMRYFNGSNEKTILNISTKISWKKLTITQQRGLLLLPILSLVGSPAMALLPALAPTLDKTNHVGLALPLLFARSLGQLFGPFLLPIEKFKKMSNSNLFVFFSLAVFFICYIYIPYCENIYSALALVFIAHVFSNIVFALAIYSVLIHFDESYVSAASAKAHRFQIIVSCFAPLGAGYLADYIGAPLALCIFSGSGFLIAGIILVMNRRNHSIQKMKSVFNNQKF